MRRSLVNRQIFADKTELFIIPMELRKVKPEQIGFSTKFQKWLHSVDLRSKGDEIEPTLKIALTD